MATTKRIEYVDQSASGLALNLIDGTVDAGAFTIFRTATVNQRDVTIRAAIIGASHVLSFATPGAVLTEMFACTDALGGSNRILFGPLGDLLEATTELTFADGRRYRFNASLAAPTAAARLRARATRGRRSLRLTFRFPRRSDRRATPETIVVGDKRPPARDRRNRALLSGRTESRHHLERAHLGPPPVRRLTAAVLVACVCVACGLPARTREEAKRTAAAIDAETGDIARKEAAYRTFAASNAYAPYRVYAERERWSGQFDYARAKTAAAKTTYERYVAPLLERNDSRDDYAVDIQTSRINRLISEARAYADIPQRRRAYVDQIAASYARLMQESHGNADAAKTALAALLAERDKARGSFPGARRRHREAHSAGTEAGRRGRPRQSEGILRGRQREHRPRRRLRRPRRQRATALTQRQHHPRRRSHDRRSAQEPVDELLESVGRHEGRVLHHGHAIGMERGRRLSGHPHLLVPSAGDHRRRRSTTSTRCRSRCRTSRG